MKFRPSPVLIDMDGVLEDWYGSVLRQLSIQACIPHDWESRELLELLPEKDKLNSWDIEHMIPFHLKSTFGKILDHPSIFHETEALGDYKTAFERIEEETHRQIFICSFPSLGNPQCVEAKYKKITERLGKKWTERLILTRDKSVVNGVVLVDDRPDPAHGTHEPEWQHVVFDQPWNRSHQQGKPVMTGWCEQNVANLINLINSL